MSYYGIVQWVGSITRGGAVRSHEYRSLRYRDADYAAAWCRTQVERLQREGGDVKRARVARSRKPVEYENSAPVVDRPSPAAWSGTLAEFRALDLGKVQA